ncbi:MAG: Hpt domain-containing protein [Betaproteobacteria bacterium]|nr:Hpt domain-containing protein [Betaproteobacteria bacterium]
MAESYYEVKVDASLADLIPRFMQNRRGDVQTMRTALNAGDMDTIVQTAHKMKGNGATYGFAQLSELARTIEQAARRGDSAVISTTLEAVSGYLSRVRVRFI